MSNSGLSERHITDDACAAPNLNKRRFTRPRNNLSTRMPCSSYSVSEPTAIGKRSLPLQDSSFRSEVSVLSLSSATATADNTSRFCSSCSYRNSDIRHANCALCGHELASNFPESDCTQQQVAAATDQGAIFTIDSNITLFPNPNILNSADPCLSINSLAACSRTTKTSSSTKVMSNCFDGPCETSPPRDIQQNAQPGRPSYEDEEEKGCIQPPSVRHSQTPPYLGCGSQLDEYNDHDDESLSSEDTERCSNHSSLNELAVMCDTSGESSENLSCANSLNSQVSRRKVPHDDPIEASPRQGRRSRRPLVNAHGDGIPSVAAVLITTSAPHPQPRSMEADEDISVACSRSSRTKKSIKSYIPGLLLRRKRRPSREDVSGAPPTPPSHSSSKLVAEEEAAIHSREIHLDLAFPGDYQHDASGTWSLHHCPPQSTACRDNQELHPPEMVARFQI